LKWTILLAMMIWDGVSPYGSNMKCVYWLIETPAVFAVAVRVVVVVGVKQSPENKVEEALLGFDLALRLPLFPF
jgi:hypothetical protein